MKIAVFSTKAYDKRYFEKNNEGFHFSFSFYQTQLNMNTVNLAKNHEVVCVFVNDELNKEVVEALSKLGVKLIALRCAGFNNVDLETAKQKNIAIVRVPAYSPEAVAEHATALILTLNRKTHKAYNRVREGNFSLNNLIGFNLHGKTVGVIGTGKIGRAFCEIMLGFGADVIAYDKFLSEEAEKIGVRYMAKNELLKKADIVSLHCPLNPETKHVINSESVAIMKDGVMIINTSRGALVDTKAVIQGLKTKKIGCLGLDVYEQEEDLFFEDLSETIIDDDLILRLNSFPNVLITAHQAYFTKEAMHEITETTLENIKAFKEGDELVNEVKV